MQRLLEESVFLRGLGKQRQTGWKLHGINFTQNVRAAGAALSRQSVLMNGLGLSFIVRPHPQDANRFLFGKNFVHDTVLNIDAARVCAG